MLSSVVVVEGASLAWTTWTTEHGEVVSLDGFEVTGEVAMDPRSSSVTICVEAPINFNWLHD